MQVLLLKKMREACNFIHRYTSTMTDKMREENPENHIVGFFMNLFANYGERRIKHVTFHAISTFIHLRHLADTFVQIPCRYSFISVLTCPTFNPIRLNLTVGGSSVAQPVQAVCHALAFSYLCFLY